MESNGQPGIPAKQINGDAIDNGGAEVNGSENESHGGQKTKIVVVGLGMVAISFMYVLLSRITKCTGILMSLQRKALEARC
jgi:nitrite reductase (NAD(P)H)